MTQTEKDHINQIFVKLATEMDYFLKFEQGKADIIKYLEKLEKLVEQAKAE